jgi:hypothetical protein
MPHIDYDINAHEFHGSETDIQSRIKNCHVLVFYMYLWTMDYAEDGNNQYIRCFLKFHHVVGVEESIVNAPLV